MTYGPFESAFKADGLAVPGYLLLLGLREERVGVVIDRIAAALAAGDSQHWVDVLFSGPDWRPHLVGAVALLVAAPQTLDLTTCWAALDRGSWVAPQLVVTALFRDAYFAERAKSRVAVRAGTAEPDPKLMASILAAAGTVSSLKAWAAQARTQTGVCELLALDESRDGSDQITRSWMQAAIEEFAIRRGIHLRPATA